MNSKLLTVILFVAIVCLTGSAIGGQSRDIDSDGVQLYRAAFADLDRELQAIEIDLKRLDLELSTAIAYGWREDAGDKITEWRSSVSEAFGRFRASLSTFFKNLTTRDGQRLPDWVYTASSGALDEVVTYLENRMASEDDHVRSIFLEVLRNSVRVYRNKVRTASAGQPEQSKEASKDEL